MYPSDFTKVIDIVYFVISATTLLVLFTLNYNKFYFGTQKHIFKSIVLATAILILVMLNFLNAVIMNELFSTWGSFISLILGALLFLKYIFILKYKNPPTPEGKFNQKILIKSLATFTTLIFLIYYCFIITNSSLLNDLNSNIDINTDFSLNKGLPHPMHSDSQFQSELKRDDIFKYYGHYYYSSKLVMTPNHISEIKSVLNSPKAFKAWAGPKGCGGYHPDYLISIRNENNNKMTFAICFGCSEIKFQGLFKPLYLDLKSDYSLILKNIFESYY